ncbi:glycosyltransferase [Ferriphaselus sp. R-1]|uniref:glycosyltransferase family 2 protein n=1 Tax=Ferriphaselus sp. R-1 TaxID=1485544 RepID=UPI00054FF4F2|nr:glycosyltransferase [Ferriphaselus sp. R-1]
MFSILIPTWNNLALLQLCVRSIRENSRYDHQIIVHVNDGSDGTLAWVQEQGLCHTRSPENIGICLAVNEAAMHATQDYILYLNDDMYCCPGWDTALVNKLQQLDSDLFMLSGTMIEPRDTHNPCVIVHDYGDDPANFAEAQLLADLPAYRKADWCGSTWPPTLVSKRWWFKVGGYSSEFSPGMSSDNDFSMKLWHAGCRVFLGVGDSLVYHFQCKSTGKVKKNNGGKQFLHKWGIRQSVFDHYFLRRGLPAQGLNLEEPEDTREFRWQLMRSRLKRALS